MKQWQKKRAKGLKRMTGRFLIMSPLYSSSPPQWVREKMERIFFIYLICHDFRKINGRTKIFKKCISGAVPQGVKSLPPWDTAAGA
jgi:hypothetical protein